MSPDKRRPGPASGGRRGPPPAEPPSFAPLPDAGLRAELLAFLEAALHRPAMKIEPHPMIEEHRRRLHRAQEAIGAEMALLEARGTAEEVALTLLARLDAGHLDELDADARYLGLRALDELAREFAERARAGGVSCQAPSADRFQRSRGAPKARDADAKTHQDELLDEAIEETFPASDATSPSHVDPDRRRPR